MKRKKEKHPAYKGGTRLTCEQAAAIVERWTWDGFCCTDDEIGDFLALLYTIASEPDAQERDSLVIAVEAKLLPMSPAASKAIDSVVVRRVSAQLEKGGEGR